MIVQATDRREQWRDPETGLRICFDWVRGGIADVTPETAERMQAAGIAEPLTPARLAARGPLLIKRSKAAGDVLLLTPTLAELKRQAPDLRIDFWCREEFAFLLDGNTDLRRVFAIPGELPDLKSYGLVADFDGWPEAQPERYEMNRARLCASYFGLELTETRPRVCLSQSAKEEARHSLSGGAPLVVIFLEASWPSRSWSRMKEAATLFSQAGYATLLFGAGHSRAENWQQLLAVISAADLVVTADSGPLHAAAALEVPAIAVFLSTDPAAFVGEDYDVTALQGEAECAPCARARCSQQQQECGLSLTPEAVFAAGQALLSRGNQISGFRVPQGQRPAGRSGPEEKAQ